MHSPGPSNHAALKFGIRGSVLLLLVVYTLNFLDRQIINILAELIKADLHLSDTQLGLLTGLSFALVYAILGLPVARIAERVNRPYLIGTALALWSAFTAVCGAAQSFGQLAAARFGVGVGESGGSAPAYSLIADLVPREKRGLAISVFTAAVPLGAVLGMAIGGIVGDTFGWRASFALVGAPGVLLAALVAWKLPEPRTIAQRASDMAPPFREVGRQLLASRSYFPICFGGALIGTTSYGQTAFIAPFFLRSHAAGIQEVSLWLHAHIGISPGRLSVVGLFYGLTHGAAAVAGAVLGGWLADRFGRRRPAGFLYVPIVGALTSIPLLIVALQSTNYVACTLLLILPGVALATCVGTIPASVQALVAPRARATTSAVYLLVTAVVGVGFGPVYVGMVSDHFAALGLSPADGIRWSMISVELPALLGCALLWIASRSYGSEAVT